MAGEDISKKNLIRELDQIKSILEESDERFHQIMDLYPDLITIVCEGEVVYVNDAAMTFTGIKSKDELIGKSALSFIHPDFKKIIKERIKHIQNGKYVKPVTEKLALTNGNVRDLEVTGIPLIYKGKPSILIIIKDISQRKKVESEIKQKAEDLILINSLNNAINRGDSIKEIADILCRESSRIFSSTGAIIYLVSEKKDSLDVVHMAYPKKLLKTVEKLIGVKIPEVKISLKKQTEYKKTLDTGKLRIINDRSTYMKILSECTEDKQLRRFAPAVYKLIGNKSLIVVPLISEGNPIGILDMGRKEPYTESDKERLETLSRQITALIMYKNSHEALKQSEENYRKQSEFMRIILESLTHPFCVIDVNDYTIKLANSAALSESSFEKQTCYRLTHGRDTPCDESEYQCPIEEIKRTRSPVIVEHKHLDREGNEKYFEIHSFPIFDKEGIVTEMIEYSIDISERKKAQETVRKSELRHRLIFDQSMDGIIIACDGIIESVNQAICTITDMKPEDMIGKDPVGFIHPEDLYKVKERIADLLKGKSLEDETVYRAIRPDGTVIWVEVRSRPFELEGKRMFQSIVRDITGRKRVEEELMKAQKLESLSILAGGIAHDFNNLLTGILGNISLAKININPESKIFRILVEAENAAIKTKSLTQQLLTFAKGGSPIKKMVSIPDFIKDSASFALRGSRVKCEFSFPDNPWQVKVDEGQMNQVINNLIINADMAMPEGGVIMVTVENVDAKDEDGCPALEGKYIRISIEDQGIGIKKEYLHKIFDPYFTTKQKGSGLGLATTYSIVSKHNGFITVESELGKGTIFCVYLPASEEKIPVKKISEETAFECKAKVLVMDDEEIVREVLTSMLRYFGCTVKSTIDGEETLKLYQEAFEFKEPFDVVIMDLTIPGGIGGKETVKKLLKIDPHAKVIVSSGYSSDPIVANFQKYGFKGFVIKPYKMEELSEILKEVLEK